MKFSTLIQNLKKQLFGKEHQQPEPQGTEVSTLARASVRVFSDTTLIKQKKRQPYLIQVGFDFGTSYSKCICRDVMTDKAWVHIPKKCEGEELPFLLSGALIVKDGKIDPVDNPRYQYPENGIYHLKHALVKTALGQWNDPVLKPYQKAIGTSEPGMLRDFVETCSVYFLAGALGEVRADIRKRFPEFGSLKEDYMAVNLAIPVANAQFPEINTLYQKILCEAWGLADKLTGHPSQNFRELKVLRKEKKHDTDPFWKDSCYIYPEVSANVQGFVLSRVSSEGIYLFSDTGASTVDQSVFIFIRRNGEEYLTYLYGNVLPLGSSQIEYKAAMNTGNTDWQFLEKWREIKEHGDTRPELSNAQKWIEEQLTQGTESTLAFAKQKLHPERKDQLQETRIIFGGGGHCEYPYKSAVMKPFSGQLFRQSITPDVVSLPPPRDLDLEVFENRWMRRLSVAYGLSFEKSRLSDFIYPNDVDIPAPLPPRKTIPDAPGQEVC